MKVYDCLIVGAGVVGCCLASDLSRSGYSVAVVDKASDVATGASKANSGLVHAGFDCKVGTLKAKLNVLGNRLFPSVAKRLGIKLNKTGAVVVGDDIGVVRELYSRGEQNGVKNMQILGREELKSLVPSLGNGVTVGLLAKDAYIVSPYLLTICLAEEAILNGAEFMLETELVACEKSGEVFKVLTTSGEVLTKKIINSAGAGVNEVSKVLKAEKYNIEYRRGEYYVLDSTEGSIVPLTVFPLPSKAGKGVLVTPTIDGNILVGPTSYESDCSTKTTLEGLTSVKERASTLVNNVNLRKSIRQFAGIRSIVGDDFVIEKSKKVDGVITLAGICSPGLSSAPAISRYVIDMMGLKYEEKPLSKKIQPYFLYKNLSRAEREELVKKNNKYGKIVCKCENITEGDIEFALSRPLKINSVDGVKRRVRAGMGRCQGGFCFLPVAEIIAKKRKIPLEMVIKENKNSQIFMQNIRGGK